MAKQVRIVEKMPNWAVGLISVAIVGATLYIGYKVYRKIKDEGAKKDSKKVSDDAKDELSKLKANGAKLSFPLTTYSATANTIVKLLDGCETASTEIQVIEEIIKVVKSPIDWYQLIASFGSRDISDCGTFGMGKTNYDLISLLKDQLDTSGVYNINRDGFKSKGVTSNTLNVLTEFLKTKGISI